MTVVGIRELRAQASQLIRLIQEKGETVDVTYHGKVVARLVPVSPSRKMTDQAWTDLDRLAAEIGRAWQGSPNAVHAIREERREL